MKTPEFLKDKEAVSFIDQYMKTELIDNVDSAFYFLSQPFQEGMIIEPDEPQIEDYADPFNAAEKGNAEKVEARWYADYEVWQNWQPLIRTDGEFKIWRKGIYSGDEQKLIYHNERFICKLSDLKILDDLIRELNRINIETTWV